jgi:hypothetical protein
VGPIKHCLMGGPGKSSENQVSVGHLVRAFKQGCRPSQAV